MAPSDKRTDDEIWNAACIQATKMQQNEQDNSVKQENDSGYAFGSSNKKTSSWASEINFTQDTREEQMAQNIFSDEIRRRDIKKDQPRLGRSAHKVLRIFSDPLRFPAGKHAELGYIAVERSQVWKTIKDSLSIVEREPESFDGRHPM